MAGAKFQYDESGGTFFYFLLSFLALIVIPCTYYFWPKKEEKSKLINKKVCKCHQCYLKSIYMKKNEPLKNFKRNLIKFLIILGWLILIATAYKCTKIKHDHIAWDPFEILEIPPGSSVSEIKKAYRKLSLKYHPDKETGNQEKFVKITKAYAALTDETARKNWEQYGNPDGPGATSFGIALPSWIVEKENSFIVLGLYALVFMIALPTVVGIWWYRSIKFGGEHVLLDTTQLYYYFIHKTPHMMLKRVIMIIGSSLEFCKTQNSEIVERESDQYEMPALMREIPNLGESNKEKPLSYPYSLKARALIYAHLLRLKLPPKTLELDKMYIVKKLPNLISEFVLSVAQMTLLAFVGRVSKAPALETLENAMKLCPLVIQAVAEGKNILLQLPHVNESNLKVFSTRKRNIRTILQLALLRDNERRSMLKIFTDQQYEDILNVISQIPVLNVTARTEVIDDKDTTKITSGAIVTVTVCLERSNMSSYIEKSKLIDNSNQDNLNEENQNNKNLKNSTENLNNSSQIKKQPVWKKNKKGGHKGGKSKKKNTIKKVFLQRNQSNALANKAEHLNESNDEEQQLCDDSSCDSDDENDANAINHENTDNSEKNEENVGNKLSSKEQKNDSDEEDWDRFQEKVMKKEKVLETKSKFSHPVHCPYFPDDKQEYWWIYLIDRKKPSLCTMPVLMTNLVSKEEIELKFFAPMRPGIYKYTVVVRSDSYVDLNYSVNIRFEVQKDAEYKVPVQWDFSEEDEEEDREDDDAIEDSDLLESDDSDENIDEKDEESDS